MLTWLPPPSDHGRVERDGARASRLARSAHDSDHLEEGRRANDGPRRVDLEPASGEIGDIVERGGCSGTTRPGDEIEDQGVARLVAVRRLEVAVAEHVAAVVDDGAVDGAHDVVDREQQEIAAVRREGDVEEVYAVPNAMRVGQALKTSSTSGHSVADLRSVPQAPSSTADAFVAQLGLPHHVPSRVEREASAGRARIAVRVVLAMQNRVGRGMRKLGPCENAVSR